MTGRLLLLAAVLLAPRTSSGQALSAGTRVRVQLDTGSMKGMLAATPSDSIGIRACLTCSPTVVAMSRVKRIDVSVGKHLSVRNTVVGGLLGTVVGGGVGAWIGDASCSQSCGLAAVVPGMVGAGVGLVIGSIAGSGAKKESWRPAFP